MSIHVSRMLVEPQPTVMGAQYLVCILFFQKKSLDLGCIWKIKDHQVVLLSLNLKKWYVEADIYFIID